MPPPPTPVPDDVQRLAGLRRSRSTALAIIVSTFYGLVAIACAFAPAFLARPLFSSDSSVSIGIVAMAAVIGLAVATSGYYTWWSNTVRDPEIARVLASRRKASG